ncbi:RICIN domain-containing protein [Micromonospora sp. URMC 105]|uniref:RICIN domain-containing protein n=1 Tax=Micromonospora sp. URMC 105 TaxID=3423413 RepID=UPI003F1B46EB
MAISSGFGEAGMVWHVGGNGTADGSPVTITEYQVGLAGAAVARQRWVFDPVAGKTFVFSIRNPVTGKCLARANDTATSILVIATCAANSARQQWSVPRGATDAGNYDGFRVVSVTGGRCVETGEGEMDPQLAAAAMPPLQLGPCGGSFHTWQRWQMRTGLDGCTVRTREWQVLGRMCVAAGENLQGFMSAWRNESLTVGYQKPEERLLSNTARAYLGIQPIDAQGGNSRGGSVEFGWQADGPARYDGSTAYSAYWLENGNGREEYHAVPGTWDGGVDNGSRTANRQMHTYLLLGTGNAGQWDVLYDYNPVGTTKLQQGGRMRTGEVGMYIRNLNLTQLAQPLDYRTQLLTAGGQWRRPTVAETATGVQKTCGGPPVYEDFSDGQGNNQPPYCLALARTTKRDAPQHVEAFHVTKPAVAAATTPATAPTTAAPPAVHNGVDQQRLAACLRTDASRCLTQVPGLHACVAARKVCNLTGRAAATARAAGQPGMTLDQARTAATRTVNAAGARGARSAAVPVVAADTVAARDTGVRLPVDVRADEAVHVVTGDGTVRSLGADPSRTYRGWRLVYQASTGVLLHGCLGAGCTG